MEVILDVFNGSASSVAVVDGKVSVCGHVSKAVLGDVGILQMCGGRV